MLIAVYLTFCNDRRLYLGKVFSVFKVTLPVVGGWIRITCLSSRTTLLHRYPWKRSRHSSTPSEVPRSHSGGLAKWAQHNRGISASQSSPPLRGTLHVPDSFLSGETLPCHCNSRQRSHRDRGSQVFSLYLEKLFCSLLFCATEDSKHCKGKEKVSWR